MYCPCGVSLMAYCVAITTLRQDYIQDWLILGQSLLKALLDCVILSACHQCVVVHKASCPQEVGQQFENHVCIYVPYRRL